MMYFSCTANGVQRISPTSGPKKRDDGPKRASWGSKSNARPQGYDSLAPRRTVAARWGWATATTAEDGLVVSLPRSPPSLLPPTLPPPFLSGSSPPIANPDSTLIPLSYLLSPSNFFCFPPLISLQALILAVGFAAFFLEYVRKIGCRHS